MLWLIARMWQITWSYDKGMLRLLVIVIHHTHHIPLERQAKIMLLDPNIPAFMLDYVDQHFFWTSVESMAEIWMFHCGKSSMSLRKYKQRDSWHVWQNTICPVIKRRVCLHLFIQLIFLLLALQIFVGHTTFGNKRIIRPRFSSWVSYFVVGVTLM